ncbi:MAG: beta-lactamase family protein [Thermoplasmatales archaeon]|nr:beta-lactamase family protein [Thermoplasmatales archaeon]
MNTDIDSQIEELMEYGHFPVVVACIIKNNEIVWSEAYGYSRYYLKKEATIDAVFPIGSVTKSVNAVAVMQLNEKGLIDLDNDVSEYLGFDLKNPKHPDVNITCRMLLAHQSSLKDTILNYYFFNKLVIRPENWLKFYVKNSKRWYDYAPGEEVCYATLGNNILGVIIEKVSKQSFEDYVQEHIFDPLQMENTSFYFSRYDSDKLAGLYVWKKGIYFRMPHRQYKKIEFAGGGALSTIEDVSHFLIMHLNGGVYNGTRILSEESVEEMHRVQYPGSYDDGFLHGFGWYSKGSIGGHGGRFHGAGTEMKMRYTDKTGVIFFWNQYPFEKWYFKSVPSKITQTIAAIGNSLFEKADEL